MVIKPLKAALDNKVHLFKLIKHYHFRTKLCEIRLINISKPSRLPTFIGGGPILDKHKDVGLSIFSNSLYSLSSNTLVPSISLSHIKRILSMKKMEVKDGYTCLTTRCISCKQNNNSERNLFINKVTGYFLCTKCKASGSWDSLEKALNRNELNLSTDETVKTSSKWATICEKSETLQSLPQSKVKSILTLFQFKDTYEDKLIELESLVNESGTHLYVPIKNGERIIGLKEITSDGVETTVPNIGCKGLLEIKCQKNQQKKGAVIVHSVRDMLALASSNLPYDVICLPHGTTSLPQEVLPLLEEYVKIILWFGNDESQWESARQFAIKLNEQRCYLVRFTEKQKTPHQAVEEFRDLMAILESAVPIAHKSIIHISQLREDILSHISNIDKAAGVKWTRFPSLNNTLKGHRRGEMTILTGPSGVGKTTFMSEYSLDLAMQGVTTLWGSFEIKNEHLGHTMLQQFCQLPIHLHLDQFNKWTNLFEQLPIYFMTFHGQQPLKTVMEAVGHASYVHDISHVIIDNIQFMMGQSESNNGLDRFYRQDSIVGAFRNFATTANCHVTLIIHPRKEREMEMLTINSVFGGAKATQEADNVLIIQQKTLQNLKLKKFVQIVKNRYSGDLGVVPLDFNKESLSYAQKSHKNGSDNEEINRQT